MTLCKSALYSDERHDNDERSWGCLRQSKAIKHFRAIQPVILRHSCVRYVWNYCVGASYRNERTSPEEKDKLLPEIDLPADHIQNQQRGEPDQQSRSDDLQ